MMRRDWVLALGAGLWAGLLSGCLRPRVDHIPPDVLADLARVRPEKPRGTSPYHPQPSSPGGEEQSDGPPVLPANPSSQPTRSTPPAKRDGPPLDVPPPPGPLPGKAAQVPEAESVERVAAAIPAPPREEPLLDALRCYKEKRPAEALDRLKPYDRPTRELLSLLLPLAARFGETRLDRARPQELAGALEQLDLLAEMLRPRAALTIAKRCFCREIKRYGVYEPLPAEHVFRPGAGDRPGDFVRVYVEVGNFTSRKNGPFYETALTSTLTIKDYQKSMVCQLGQGTKIDRCLSRRRDCFLDCYFNVPQKLPAGRYTLWIKVMDVTGLPEGAPVPPHRIAERSLDFHVGNGDYALAPRGP